jgi:structural maintenance of chromosome 3 (chondroitin sulfate proteoglycan 6)
MVSFEAKKDPVKRWNEYSAGQKTVIAVCLLMALQKCKPAAFYIFDEMDAALDPVYLQRIVKIIK